MLNQMKQLKQQNKPAFNFVIAGVTVLLLVMITLVFLVFGLIEQRNIAKQIDDLQKVGKQLSHFSANTMLIQSNQIKFAEFERLVKKFNQQWSSFKQQYNYYPVEDIKYADEILENINDDTKIILAAKNDIITLQKKYDNLLVNIKKLNEKNKQFIDVLLENNIDDRYITLAKDTSESISNTQNYLKENYLYSLNDGFYGLWGIDNITDDLWHGTGVFHISKNQYKKINTFVQDYRSLYFDVQNIAIDTRNHYGEVYVIDAPQVLIAPQISLFNESLAEINYKIVNNILIAIVFFGLMCILACYYCYIKSLNRKVEITKKYSLSFILVCVLALSFALTQTFLFYYGVMLKKQVEDLVLTIEKINDIKSSSQFIKKEEKSFLEFKLLVKKFNHQCYKLYKIESSKEKIQEIETARKKINKEAQRFIAMYADHKAQKTQIRQRFLDLDKMQKNNENLVDFLLQEKASKDHIIAAKLISTSLLRSDYLFKEFYQGLGYGVHPHEDFHSFTNIKGMLNSLWKGGELSFDYQGYKIIDRLNNNHAREIIKNEIELYENISQEKASYRNTNYYYQAEQFSTGDLWFLLKNTYYNDYGKVFKSKTKDLMAFIFVVWFWVVFLFYIKNIKQNIYKIIMILTVLFFCLNVVSNIFFSYDPYALKVTKVKVDDLSDKRQVITKFIYEDIQESLAGLKEDKFIKLNNLVKDFDKKWQYFRKNNNDIDGFDELERSINDLYKIIKFINANKTNLMSFYANYINLESMIIDESFNTMTDFNNRYKSENYAVKDLLLLIELNNRLSKLDGYLEFAYVSQYKAIFNENIDLTLSDYIKKLPNSNGDAPVVLPPEILKKMDDISLRLDSLKPQLLIVWELRNALSNLEYQNYKLAEYFTKLEKENAEFQNIKSGIILVVYAWLCVFACVRALQTEKTEEENP